MKFLATLTAVLLAAGMCMMSFAQTPSSGPASVSAATRPVADSQPGATMQASPRLTAFAKMAMEKNPADKAELAKGLSDPDPRIRRYSTYGLERIGDPASAKDIAPLLKDKDAFVSRGAAVSMGKLKSKDAVAPLVQALADNDVRLRKEAILALGRIAAPSSQADILKAMKDDLIWNELSPSELNLLLNVFYCDFFTDRGAMDVLKKALDFKNSANVELATENKEDREADALFVSYKAAEILAVKFGDASGEADLIAAVAPGDDYMQQSGADALGAIKSRKAVPALLKMLEGEWMVNRRKAVLALGAIGDASAVPALEKLLVAPPPATAPASRGSGEGRGPRTRPAGEPDARMRALVAATLEKIDGKKRVVDVNDPPAAEPKIAEGAVLKTPGGKRPPVFICTGVDDCTTIEGLEGMLDVCETLKDNGAKAVFTLWISPLMNDYKNRDLLKQTLIYQRLFDLGCEIANHTLMHNPGGTYWAAREPWFQVQAVEGAVDWYRGNIAGFATRPFTFKGGGGAIGKAGDPNFTKTLMARQRFLYSTGRNNDRPAEQAWATGKQSFYRMDAGCLDAAAPPVHEVVTDPIYSDYSGRFDYSLADGVAMWKANFEYRYNHPERPIMVVNAFHDWGMRKPGELGAKASHRNESAMFKAFLLDVLVKNKDKYPDAYCVTLRQVVEYIATDGDLKHTLEAGNCQDGRNPVKPKAD
jgi:HEAT repeat protein